MIMAFLCPFLDSGRPRTTDVTSHGCSAESENCPMDSFADGSGTRVARCAVQAPVVKAKSCPMDNFVAGSGTRVGDCAVRATKAITKNGPMDRFVDGSGTRVDKVVRDEMDSHSQEDEQNEREAAYRKLNKSCKPPHSSKHGRKWVHNFASKFVRIQKNRGAQLCLQILAGTIFSF